MDDDLVDDVFEEDDPAKYYQNTDTGLNINDTPFFDDVTPSPTSQHPAFRDVAAKSNPGLSSDFDDGWKSFKIEDDNGFDESVLHKVSTHNTFIACPDESLGHSTTEQTYGRTAFSLDKLSFTW